MKCMLIATVLFATQIAHAVYTGPVGTPCSGTTTLGTAVSGTQGWSVNPRTGRGYWSCCAPGTSCVGRGQPEIVKQPTGETSQNPNSKINETAPVGRVGPGL